MEIARDRGPCRVLDASDNEHLVSDASKSEHQSACSPPGLNLARYHGPLVQRIYIYAADPVPKCGIPVFRPVV